MIKRSNGRRQKYVSMLIPFHVSERWRTVQEQQKDGRVKWKDSGCIRLTKKQWESMEKQLNSSGKISHDFHHLSIVQEIQQDLERRNIQHEEFKKTRLMTLISKNDDNCISNSEKVKNYAMKFPQGHWTFLGSGSEEKWYGSSSYAQKGWDSTANKMVQQFKETGHLAFESISALSRGILKLKKGKSTIHFNGHSMNTELLFQTIHSVNQLSIYGAVANWCHQFGLTEEENGRTCLHVDNMYWPR